MPSPLAHLGAGYVIYRLSDGFAPESLRQRFGPLPAGLLVALGASMAPDSDSILGILTGQFGRFHNNLTHSFFVAGAFALALGSLLQWRSGKGFRYWTGLSFAAYAVHVLMDAAAVSRGVMAFWPLSNARVLSPVTLFYGLHWSDGLLSPKHIITVVTELGFVALIVALSEFALRRVHAVRQ